MRYKIIYYYNGSHSLSSKIIEAKNEKEALAKVQGVYGSNPRYEITSVICQTDSGTSAQFNDQESASEAANKLTAYKARQTAKEQEPIWFYTVDGENIEGPVGLASIQSKVDQGILKEDSLVMKTGDDWMTISEFKTTGSSIADSKSFSSFAQSHNAKPVPVKATASSPSSTQASDQPSPYSRDAIHFAQEAGSRLAEAPNKYPSLLVSFWFIYVLGSFLISLISGPLLSVFLNHQSDILETLTAKLKIMALIGFLYLLIAAVMVHLSSSEYRAQMFQWHYFARGIVFLHVLLVGFRMFEVFQY